MSRRAFFGLVALAFLIVWRILMGYPKWDQLPWKVGFGIAALLDGSDAK